MLFSLVLLSFELAFALPLPETPPYSKKYPYGLITPHYGILTENDLANDTCRRRQEPYIPKKFQSGSLFWQCFPVKNVKNKYHTWKGHQGQGPSTDPIITMCDLEIWAERDGDLHIFSAPRAHPVEYCRAYLREWTKLTRSQKFVCIDGENNGETTEKSNGISRFGYLWMWKKFKTKVGCYSYRKGDCDEVQVCSQ